MMPSLSGQPLWVYVLASVATIVGTAAGAVVMLRKMGPEVNRINVETSETLVQMAARNAEMHAADAKDLRERNKILDDRLTEYARQLGAATERIGELERKAAEIESLRAEVARLQERWDAERNAKELLADENNELRGRVTALEGELAVLKANGQRSG